MAAAPKPSVNGYDSSTDPPSIGISASPRMDNNNNNNNRSNNMSIRQVPAYIEFRKV